MQIDPTLKPISEIFPIEGKDKYIIPPYQRNYTWKNEVDGQQRLTTLSLYFLAIFEYLTEKSTEIFHKGPTEKILC